MTESTLRIPAHLTSSCIDEYNSYIAGAVSLIFNIMLIWATSKVKIYSSTVRKIQYYVCIVRLLFSITVIFTSPTLVYVKRMKSLYIVKGGLEFSIWLGEILLILFVVFIVSACVGPTIQYLQVLHILAKKGHDHDKVGPLINMLTILIGIPTLILTYAAFLPSPEEEQKSQSIVQHLNGEGNHAFLIAPIYFYNPESNQLEPDWWSRICISFIMLVMLLSVIIVIFCNIFIQREMKQKAMSSSALKSQKQLNIIMLVQFFLPFITIHIPFYICFALPFLDVENPEMSIYLPYLFSWCPAINPILVLISVKTIRDRLFCIKSLTKTSSSLFVRVRGSTKLVLLTRVFELSHISSTINL